MGVQALYIHVPFCVRKCAYCDFWSRAARPGSAAVDGYVERVSADIEKLGQLGALADLETAYVGGGTPSLLGEGLVGLVRRIRRYAIPVELTCEANPDSFTPELARALKGAGATRVSLGVQSFVDAELAALGRVHSAADAERAVQAALEAGLNVSLDLMCGIPLQTEPSWAQSLERALDAGVGHVSVYPLTLEEGTPLACAAERDPALVPDEDFQAWCMEEARAQLSAGGLLPYEVASYARPGAACRHNIAYWSGGTYLGVGRAASSMLDLETYEGLAEALGLPAVGEDAARLRFSQVDDGPLGTAAYEVEELTGREALAEDLMLGMRMTCGLGAALLQRAERVLGEGRVRAACAAAERLGLARWVGAGPGLSLAPTERGWLLGNELFELFWDLADD